MHLFWLGTGWGAAPLEGPGHQCVLILCKTIHAPCCIRKNMVRELREVIPIYLALLRPHLEFYMKFPNPKVQEGT